MEEVIIVGGGLVGKVTALALRDAGLSAALVQMPKTPDSNANWDSRIYALSPGSVRFLENCKAWEHVDQSRVAQIAEMHIYGDDGKSLLIFSAHEAATPMLAVTVENRELEQAMGVAATGIETHFGGCDSLDWDDDSVVLGLSGGGELRAHLIVGADGANSWVREQAGIVSYSRSYGQSAVVANFECEKPHRNIAYQWFRRDGVLAYLPLPGERVSIVFSTWDEEARKLATSPAPEFCAAVAEAGRHVLGELSLITPARIFSLQKMEVEQLIGPRVVLVGDAAHVVHPLAGQGVNIGFRDAYELAKVLQRSRAIGDCGDRMLLRRYERSRKEDHMSMGFTTDGLQKLFNNNNVWLSAVRNLGLKLTDSTRPLKTALIRRALT
ncbi:MAG: UbiH/UbiF family hydroxylase [Burkholderiales bacterium]